MHILTWLSLALCHTLLTQAVEDPETCKNDNIMGALGSGVIASDNFGFDYRNGSTSSKPRRCTHRIYMNYRDSSKGRTICFTFHRFDLEYSDGCFNDYLQFPDNHLYDQFPDNKRDVIKYCGKGTWNRGNQVHIISNAFSQHFCWPAESSTFDILFHADTHLTGRGYFAEFTIHDVPAETDNKTEEPPSSSCDFDPTKCTQYCFHGHVEINGCKTCDCIEGATAPCFPDKYTCFSRQCVDAGGLCDGVADCDDGSDEDYLHARCPDSQGLEACHFDDPNSGWCQYQVESGWFRANTSPYGPRYDHTYGTLITGHFMYTEAYEEGQAVLSYTTDITLASPRCFTFWYFMNGYVGGLGLEVTQAGEDKPLQLWSRLGHHNPRWLLAEVDFPEGLNIHKIIIRANDTFSDDGNIAIDDVTFAEGKCWGGDISCKFELGMCKWTNDLDRAQTKWVRQTGLTRIMTKEPESQNSGSGYYMYVNSSHLETNTKAVLISAPVSNGGGSSHHCLSFSYYMHGAGMGQLEVSALLNDNITMQQIWTVIGDQGDQWNSFVNLFTGLQGPFRLLITATVGQTRMSDFVIDNIVYTSEICPTTSKPPVEIPSTRSTEAPATCQPGYWTCTNGECIREEYVCDGRFDCGDKSDEMECRSMINLSVGTIIGISIALVFLLLVVGGAVFVVHRRQKLMQPAAPSESQFDLHSPVAGDLPPPYIPALDNPAYSGPSTQLPSYSTVTKKLPPYSPNADSPPHKHTHKAKQDNMALVGFGALGSPAGMAPLPIPPTRQPAPPGGVYSMDTYPQNRAPGGLPGRHGIQYTGSPSAFHPQDPPPSYGETPC